jgi:hypothetical protein
MNIALSTGRFKNESERYSGNSDRITGTSMDVLAHFGFSPQ